MWITIGHLVKLMRSGCVISTWILFFSIIACISNSENWGRSTSTFRFNAAPPRRILMLWIKFPLGVRRDYFSWALVPCINGLLALIKESSSRCEFKLQLDSIGNSFSELVLNTVQVLSFLFYISSLILKWKNRMPSSPILLMLIYSVTI